MPEDKSGGRPVGATGSAVRKNIRRIRDAKGVSANELSEALRRLNRPIPPLGISRIENGQRRVDVDDLVAIASALGVSPATLLMPATNDDDSEVREGDNVALSAWNKPIGAVWTWEWLTAAHPLVSGTRMTSFVQHAWPAWERDQFDAQVAEEIRKKRRGQAYGEPYGDD